MYVDPESYRPEYPPTTSSLHRILDVVVSLKILTISDIEEITMSFNVKFSLTLSWKDERLTFYNLNQRDQSNIVGGTDRKNIWIPPLIFSNTNDNIRVKNTDSTNIFIRRMGNNKPAPLASIEEDYWYSGSENVLVFNKDYSLQLRCTFKLHSYPFDTQMCSIQVNIIFRL